MESGTVKTRIPKKVLCMILSFIIALGTFITFTGAYSPLHELLGIKYMLSAYAAEIVDTHGAVAVAEEEMLANDHSINLINRDGSNTVYLFSEPISFTDENGNLRTKDISVEKQKDNELKSEGYEYTNGSNDYRINFSKDYHTGIKVEFNGGSYSIIPQSNTAVEGEETVAEYLDDTFEVFQYENIYGSGTNLRFYPQLNGVKDEIVLNQNINQNTFSFTVNTENCTAQLNEDGTVSLQNEVGESVQTFSAPYAYDSVYVDGDFDNHRTDCEYTLEANGDNSYTLTVTVPDEWLNSNNTVYPVVVDPTTINVDTNRDAGIYSSYPNNCYGSEQTACIGKSHQYGNGRVYMHFLWPSEIQNYATINSAFIWLRETTGRTTDMYVQPYIVQSGWSESTITWNNRPYMDATSDMPVKNINSQSTDWPSSPYWYKMYITSAVQKWANLERGKCGIGLYSDEEEKSTYNWRAFATIQHATSSYRPYTVINYTNDTTAPTYTSVTKSPNTIWSNHDVTITVNGAADSQSGLANNAYSFSTDPYVANYQASNSYVVTSSCHVYVHIKDKAGNFVYCACKRVDIDRIAPTISAVSSVDNNNGTATVTVTASDDNSGITGYSFDGGSTWQTEASKTMRASLKPRVAVKDAAGNITHYNDGMVTPEIYNDNGLIRIFSSAFGTSGAQYKIDNGAWQDYTGPFEIPVNTDVTVYARNANNTALSTSKILRNDFGEYTESSVDMSISYFNAGFDIERIYNSNSGWFWSFNSAVDTVNSTQNVIYAVMPDATQLAFERTSSQNNYTNYSTGYSLVKLSDGYIISDGSNNYRYDLNGTLVSVSDLADNAITFTSQNGVITSITAGTGRTYTITYSNSQPVSIENPLGESITYEYSADGLTDAYWDKDSFVIADDNDIILGEYAYTNGRLSQSLFKSISYNASNQLSSELNADGSYVNYAYSTETYTYPAEGEEQGEQISVNKLVSTASDSTTTTLLLNNALLTVSQTDAEGKESVYKYDNNYNVISETSDSKTTVYTYDSNGYLLSTATGEDASSSYTYDSAGNVLTEYTYSKEDDKETRSYTQNTYTNGLLTQSVQSENSDYSNAVTSTYTGGLLTQVVDNSDTSKVLTTIYTYDNYGNTASVTVATVANGNSTSETTTYTYDALNRTLTQTTGEDTTSFIYDAAGNTIRQTDENGTSRIVLDEYSRKTMEISAEDYEAEADGLPNSNTYVKLVNNEPVRVGHTYTYNNLNQLVSETNRLGITSDYTYHSNGAKATEEFDIYYFEFNSKGNTTSIEIAGNPYADYTYDANDNLVQIEYGNGQIILYEYNTNNQITAQKYKESENAQAETQFVYEYTTPSQEGGEPKLASKTDYINNRKTVYGDNDVVTIYNITYENNTEVLTLYYSYYETPESTDENTNVTTPEKAYSVFSDKSLESVHNTEKSESISLKTSANQTISAFDYSYITDTDDKVTSSSVTTGSGEQTATVLTTAYTYNEKGNVTSETTTFADNSQVTRTYSYDDKGNIIEYHQDGNSEAYYTYDSNNQLIREDRNYAGSTAETDVYTYDNRGNIVSIDAYAYTRNADLTGLPHSNETLDASYEDDIWYDELTEINSDTVLYDEIGNPVQLSDCNLVWTEGRQLAAVTYTENNQTVTLLSYTYDENGIRTSKTYEGIITYYTTEDGRITSQYQLDGSGNKTEEIIFIYNKSGELIAAEYSGKTYYYAKNTMGDVCAIVDDTGTQIVSYNYYAFGTAVSNVNTSATSSDQHFAAINPMQYRSYYWDADLGAYYLQSRYYAPDWCRFVNADMPEIAGFTKDNIAGINLFAYCNNNPVNNSDPTGNISIAAIIGAIIGFGAGVILLPLFADYKGYKGSKRKWFIGLGTAVTTIIGGVLGHYIGKALIALYSKGKAFADILNKAIAKSISKITRVSFSIARGEGYKLSFGKYVIRIMTSSKRVNNYIRISHITKGAMLLSGKYSSDRVLTHIPITIKNLVKLVALIFKLK